MSSSAPEAAAPLLIAALADAGLRLQVLQALPPLGYRVLTAADAQELPSLIEQHGPDLLVLDVAMADATTGLGPFGLPTLALCRLDDPALPTRLLRERGVTVCLPLPLAPPLLAAAADALQRLGPRSAIPSARPALQARAGEAHATWQLARTAWLLTPPGAPKVRLNQAETLFLATLAARPGEAVARSALIAALGHHTDYYDSRRLDTLVSRLRLKVSRESGQDLPLRSIHAVGYALVVPLAVTD